MLEVVVVGRSSVDEGTGSNELVVKATLLEIALVGKTSGTPGGAGNVVVDSENALATLEGSSKGTAEELVDAGTGISMVDSMYCAIPGTVVTAVDMAVTVVCMADEEAFSSFIVSSIWESPWSPSSPSPSLAGRSPESWTSS